MMEIRLSADRHQHQANYERWREFPIKTLFMDGQRNWTPDSQLAELIDRIRLTRMAGFRVKLRACCKTRYEIEHNTKWSEWSKKGLARLKRLLTAVPEVEEWQVMNEPNLWAHTSSWGWQAFFDLTAQARELILRANPNAVIVLAGLNDGGAAWKNTGEPFLQTICHLAAKYGHAYAFPADRASVHLWRVGWALGLTLGWWLNAARGIEAYLRACRACLDYHSFSDVPLELGEIGRSVDQTHTEEEQRDFLRAVVTAAHQVGIQSVTWWDWAGTTNDPKVSPLVFNGEPRLACQSFIGFCGAFNRD
jgi:hypothetical protein